MTPLLAGLLAGWVVPEHLGALHPFEKALTLLLAFGPFVVLALAIRHTRRRDR